MGVDESIIEAARMSTGKGFISWDPYGFCEECGTNEEEYVPPHYGCKSASIKSYPRGDAGLLEHLYKNKHMTPFEMCDLVIEVQAPIFVFREWHRHRTQSFNEFSARYSVMPNLHYIPTVDRLTPKISTNKQESSITAEGWLDPIKIQSVLKQEQDLLYVGYESMLSNGIPKEVARLDTPVSRYSKMRAKANLRNWLGFLMLRKAPDAQWEIRQFADAVGQIVQALWPRTYELFLNYDFNSARFSALEMKVITRTLTRLSMGLENMMDTARLDPDTGKLLMTDKELAVLVKKLTGK